MFPFRGVVARQLFAKVFPLLSSLFLCLLLSGVTSFAVEISVTTEEAGAVVPVANALVKLNDRVQYTDPQGIARIDLKKGENVRLSVTHPAYLSHSENITGDGNQTAQYPVLLIPDALFEWRGQLLDNFSKTPVVGAKLSLDAYESTASIESHYKTFSDWDGNFQILGCSPGKYHLRIEHPAFENIDRIIECQPSEEPTVWELEASITRTGKIKVKIIDSVTGAPIKGVNARLEEGFEVALVDEQVSGNTGTVVFNDIKIGIHNRSNEEGRQRVTVSKLLVNLKAEGYFPCVFAVDVGGDYTMKLDPIRTIQETGQNNDTMTEAQLIEASVDLEHKIESVGDIDFFKFELLNDAHVNIKGEGTIQRHYRLYNLEGDVLWQQGVHGGTAANYDYGLTRGVYFIEVMEWGNNDASEENCLLTLRSNGTADGLEPNNDQESARVVQPGVSIHGIIFPVADKDFFRFRLDRPSVMRYELKDNGIQRYAALNRIDDETLTRVSDAGTHNGSDLILWGQVQQPGDYLLRVEEWGNNNYSHRPYRSTLNVIPDDGIDDPELTPEALPKAQKQMLNQRHSTTILPMGDYDVFRFDPPTPGMLMIEGYAPHQLHLSVLNAKGESLYKRGAHVKSKIVFHVPIDNPQPIYLVAQEWGDNEASAAPYTISSFWYPCENREQAGRNDTQHTASSILCDTQFQGNLFPLGDVDWFKFLIPFPGQLGIKGHSDSQLHYRVYDNSMNEVIARGQHPGDFGCDISLLPGVHYLKVEEWGNNEWLLPPYNFVLDFRRAEPDETVPVRENPPRQLLYKQAQSFKIDLIGDKDTFIYECPGGEAPFAIHVQTPFQVLTRVYNDQTGELVLDRGAHPGYQKYQLAAEQPIRYRIELTEWGENERSDVEGFIMVAPPEATIAAERILIDPGNSVEKTAYFQREPIEGLTQVVETEVDVDGDEAPDFYIRAGGEASHQFSDTGAHRIRVKMSGLDGIETIRHMWVDIPHEKLEQGLAISLTQPSEGQTVQTALELEPAVLNFSQSKVQGVEFSVDGKYNHTDYSEPYSWTPPWQELTSDQHTLTIQARDNRGKQTSLTRNFELSPFFDLQPTNGTNISGENVRISWLGNRFGEAKLKIRKAGSEDAWKTLTGESGRYRSVLVEGLEPGTRYEYHVSDGRTESSLQTFNLVKGLAFGKPSYGANIKRDYDQRLGISVRNNSDDPLTVELECGEPEDSKLLVGFVGDGSADKPFALQPGEEREFTLGMSAQDVVKEDHEFPVRIVSKDGRTDEALVKVNVRLPVIKLEWQEIKDTPFGLGKIYKLHNRGDTVTDLALTASDPSQVIITPTIFHGMLPARQSIEVTVTPKMFNGFKSAATELQAKALDKVFPHDFAVEVPEGKELHQVLLMPGVDSTDSADYFFQQLNMEMAQEFEPSTLDWTDATLEEDLTGDGILDRSVMYVDGTEWIGDDTNGDGVIDFVHADIGQDGIFEYSALLREDGNWEPTNLIEGWLEMGFSLPWNANTYHPHNVDILLNDQVIGQLRDTIPNGNYTFYMPPHLIKFNERGEPGDNRIGIQSEHLRGGHYVVNSDFRFNIRMTSTPVWSVGEDATDALTAARQVEGLVVDHPDFSVSSSDLVFHAPDEIKAGDPCFIQSSIRNLGAISPESVDVILVDKRQGREPIEIQRNRITDPIADGDQIIEFSWKATPGQHKLKIIADPEETAGDLNRLNNEAITMVTVPGDDDQPTIKVLSLEVPDSSKPQLAVATIRCDDNGGINALEASIDGGIWQSVPTPGSGLKTSVKLLLQPGAHTLTFRVTDAGGNQVEAKKNLTIDAKKPTIELLYPKTDVEVQARSTNVMVACPPGTRLIAARIEGGPWYRGKITATAARAYVPLSYGEQTLEVMIVDRHGIAEFATRKVTCSRQRTEADTGDDVPPAEDGNVRIPTIGEVDYFSGLNHILRSE